MKTLILIALLFCSPAFAERQPNTCKGTIATFASDGSAISVFHATMEFEATQKQIGNVILTYDSGFQFKGQMKPQQMGQPFELIMYGEGPSSHEQFTLNLKVDLVFRGGRQPTMDAFVIKGFSHSATLDGIFECANSF